MSLLRQPREEPCQSGPIAPGYLHRATYQPAAAKMSRGKRDAAFPPAKNAITRSLPARGPESRSTLLGVGLEQLTLLLSISRRGKKPDLNERRGEGEGRRSQTSWQVGHQYPPAHEPRRQRDRVSKTSLHPVRRDQETQAREGERRGGVGCCCEGK